VQALFAIAKQTIRSSLRSRVFWVLFVLLLLSAFVLPLTISGDGTARGLVQILLTYSLGLITALLSAATLWLGCNLMPREIETYQIHLVLSKPVSRWAIWSGKFLGIFAMHAGMFAVSAAAIFGMLNWRLQHGAFSQEELATLRQEVLVGRRVYEALKPDFRRIVTAEYKRRQEEGTLPQGGNPEAVQQEIFRQAVAKSAETPPGATRFWVFRNIKVSDPDKPLFLRYRAYVGTTSKSSQTSTAGLWGILDPASGEDQQFRVRYQSLRGGQFAEIPIPSEMVSKDGTLVMSFQNQDAGQNPIIFQLADTPQLLVADSGFLANYLNATAMVLLLLAFLTALGCTVGAALTTPVAIFIGISYLIVGMSVQSAVDVPLRDPTSGKITYSGPTQQVLYYIAVTTSHVVASYDDFTATSELARGRLIKPSRIGAAFLSLIFLRGIPLALLGIWILTRREFGTVIRR
jgi:hypothetical protein